MASELTLAGCLALTGAGGECSPGPVDIVLDGPTIRSITPAGSAPPVGSVIDCRRRLAVPGFINGHTHSHENFHKGRYDNLPLEWWMNYVRPLAPIPFTPRQVYLRTLIGAIDALRSGTTTICDDTNASPILRPELIEAVYQAYRDIGIRALVGFTLFDRPFFRAMPYVDEEFPPELLAKLDATKATPPAEYLDYANDLATRFNPATHRVGYLATPSAPQRCTPEFLLKVRDLADRHDLPLIIHVQETRMQVVTGHLFYGKTMVEHLAAIGFLRPKTSLIHAVWLKPSEIELIAGAGASVQHNPQSNFKLGSGLAPVRAMLDAGINVSLGTDGCGSIENADMLKVLSQTALMHKLRGGDPERWIGAAEAFTAATTGGAQALGFGDRLGRLAPGMRADLCLYRTDDIAFSPLNNPLHQLVFNASPASLDSVYVDGEPVLRGGRLTQIDEAAILQEIADEHRVLAPMIAQAEQSVGPMLAPYRRIWERCAAHPISADTFPARFDR
jgi:5-methylthioadenosine/S-adenosylhomocysteine deaminase